MRSDREMIWNLWMFKAVRKSVFDHVQQVMIYHDCDYGNAQIQNFLKAAYQLPAPIDLMKNGLHFTLIPTFCCIMYGEYL
jgi:hypothetical protein